MSLNVVLQQIQHAEQDRLHPQQPLLWMKLLLQNGHFRAFAESLRHIIENRFVVAALFDTTVLKR